MQRASWPDLPYAEWLSTYETLHLYTQIPGKIKLALAPELAEWWHVAYGFWARGITTGPIPFGNRMFEIRFDFLSHIVEILDSEGRSKRIELIPRSVAEFYERMIASLRELGIEVTILPAPQEVEDTIPLDRDTIHCSYDRTWVDCFWQVLSRIAIVFDQFRSGFSGKSSPVQFWWGSFDLAIARFNGESCDAAPHAKRMDRIGEDEEHFAAGFWPGDSRLLQPAFYAYSYPSLPELKNARISPPEAYWNSTLGEFILPYDGVRTSLEPESIIAEFLASTYDAVANLGSWDRAFLERKVT